VAIDCLVLAAHRSILAFLSSLLTINTMSTSAQISKKRKFIADGVFQAELGEFL
jgi:hypothetical protein